MNQDPIRQALARVPMFAELDPEQIAALSGEVTARELGRDELLFQAGDPASRFYLLLEGQIKLYFNSADGHEKVIELIGPGMTFGEAVMLIGQPYPAHAQALRRSRVLTIPRSALDRLLRDDGAVALRMLASLSRRIHGLVQALEELTTHSSVQRVIGYLIGERQNEAVGVVTLQAGKALIASKLNLTPETFSRVLRELSDAGLIEVHGREVSLIDVDGLLRHGQASDRNGG